LKKWYTGSRQASPAKPNTTEVEKPVQIMSLALPQEKNGFVEDGPTIIDRGA
jgi:hypothetical protein